MAPWDSNKQLKLTACAFFALKITDVVLIKVSMD